MNVLVWGQNVSQLGSDDSLPAENVKLLNVGGWKLCSGDQAIDLIPATYVIVLQVPDAELLLNDAPIRLVQGNAYRLELGDTAILSTLEPGSVLTL